MIPGHYGFPQGALRISDQQQDSDNVVWRPADKKDSDHSHGHPEGLLPRLGEVGFSHSEDDEAVTSYHDEKWHQESRHQPCHGYCHQRCWHVIVICELVKIIVLEIVGV